MARAVAECFSSLWDRSSRQPLGAPSLFTLPEASSAAAHAEMLSLSRLLCSAASPPCSPLGPERAASLLSVRRCRAALVLSLAPGLVAHRSRLLLWREACLSLRSACERERAEPLPVVVRRGEELSRLLRQVPLGPAGLRALRAGVRASYEDGLVSGRMESGVDGGGLFKEVWCAVAAQAFDRRVGLFEAYEGGLFPAARSAHTYGASHLGAFRLLGAIVGKALLDGITLEQRLAPFFLSFLKGNYNVCHAHLDLLCLDADLHRSLCFLREFEGDVGALCLTFSVAREGAPGMPPEEVDLVPGGSGLGVTRENRGRYVHLVARYYVLERVRAQAGAFMGGFQEVLGPIARLLEAFSMPEMQVLMSGDGAFELDVDDLERHARLRGYSRRDRAVRAFYRVLRAMAPPQQAALLRFVTSCSRPPPLGFEQMHPPFTIARAQRDRLPTASTCFNTLKLPDAASEREMRDKLLLAIAEGEGFHLS